MLQIKELKELNAGETEALRKLLKDYGHYMYEELNLVDGKDSYQQQMQNFPGDKYCDGESTFLLALYNNKPAGCVRLRRFDHAACEMKRMYVDPACRGLNIGEQLGREIIRFAKKSGYSQMLLDTNKEMQAAVALYFKLGFKEIPAYCINVNQNPVYLSLDLKTN